MLRLGLLACQSGKQTASRPVKFMCFLISFVHSQRPKPNAALYTCTQECHLQSLY